MDKEKSFAEILSQSLKRYSESPTLMRNADSESYLGVEFLDLVRIKPQSRVKSKPPFSSRPKSPLPPRGYPTTRVQKKPWPLSAEEEAAFQLVRAYAPELGNPFWPKQLKRIKHHVFLRTHPDQGGSDELFRQVFAAFHLLESVLQRHFAKSVSS